MQTITKPFTTQLDRDLTLDCVNYSVLVKNKNGTIKKHLVYSPSFSIHEIYDEVKTRHPNKEYQLIIKLKE